MQTTTPIYIVILIAAMACLLAAEIFCFILLARKVRAAKRREEESAEDDRLSGLFLLASSGILRTSERVLFFLAVLCAVGALALAVAVLICRQKGYLFVPRSEVRKRPAARPAAPAVSTAVEEDLNDPWITVADEPAEVDEEPDEPSEAGPEEEPVPEPEVIPTFAQGTVDPGTAPETNGSARSRVTRTLETTVTETVREVYPEHSVKEIGYVGNELRVRDVAPTTEEEAADESEDQAQEAGFVEEPYDADGDAEAGTGDDAVLDGEDDPAHFTGNERVVGFDVERGCDVIEVYRKSFEAKLIQSPARIKRVYGILKNALLAYEGTESRVSRTMDSFSNNREPIARINIVAGSLVLYLALDPAALEGTVYRGKDVGATKRFERTPFRYLIRSAESRKCGWALELVRMVSEEHGLSPIDIEPVDYEQMYPFDTMENLVARGLVRVTTRYEQRVSTFEPDDSAPVYDEPEEPGFSFEMDNDAERPEPEQGPEPEPGPTEPVEEPAVPAGAVHTRETVRVTRTVYTETYDGTEPTGPFPAEIPSAPAPVAGAPEEPSEPEPDIPEAPAGEGPELPETPAEPEPDEEPTPAEEPEDEPEEEYARPEEDLPTGRLAEMFEADEEQEDRYTEDAGTRRSGWYGNPAASPEDEPDESEPQYPEEPEGSESQYEEEQYETEPQYGDGQYETEPQYGDGQYETEPQYGEEQYEADPQYTDEEYVPEPEPVRHEERRKKPKDPYLARVDVSILDANFRSGDTVNLEILKARGLVAESARRLRIVARGTRLYERLTVEADQFTTDAIYAIGAAGGETVILRRKDDREGGKTV